MNISHISSLGPIRGFLGSPGETWIWGGLVSPYGKITLSRLAPFSLLPFPFPSIQFLHHLPVSQGKDICLYGVLYCSQSTCVWNVLENKSHVLFPSISPTLCIYPTPLPCYSLSSLLPVVLSLSLSHPSLSYSLPNQSYLSPSPRTPYLSHSLALPSLSIAEKGRGKSHAAA